MVYIICLTKICHWSLHFHHIFVLVHALFFYLTLVPALCKSFAIGTSVKSKLKIKPKLTVCHVDQSFHATWHIKRQKNIPTFLLLFYSLFFNLKILLVPALSVFFYIGPWIFKKKIQRYYFLRSFLSLTKLEILQSIKLNKIKWTIMKSEVNHHEVKCRAPKTYDKNLD